MRRLDDNTNNMQWGPDQEGWKGAGYKQVHKVSSDSPGSLIIMKCIHPGSVFDGLVEWGHFSF